MKKTEKTQAELWKEKHLDRLSPNIEAWRKKHGGVHLYITEDGHWAIIRRPTRQELSSARLLSNRDSNLFNEAIARDVTLDGEDIVFSEDKYFYGLTEKINELIEVVEGELVKL